MEYYQIREHEMAGNVIRPSLPGTSQIWSGTGPLIVQGSVPRPEEDITFLAFYQATAMSRAFLVSSQIWGVWQECRRPGRSRPCAFGHIMERDMRPYVFVMPPVLDVLHPDTGSYKDGDIESVCLQRGRLGADEVFAVRGGRQTVLIVSEDVLERMLRAKVTLFGYGLLEQKEG